MRFLAVTIFALMVFAPVANAQDDASLFAAIEEKNLKGVAVALKAGSNVNAINEQQASALFAAVNKQAYEICRLLVAAGADVNYVNGKNIGATPLMMAAAYQDMKITNLLLENGAEVNKIDANGDPAINWAAYYGYADIAERLLNAGASTEQVGHGNPREIAMRRGHQPFVELMARVSGIKLPSPDTALLISSIKTENMEGLEEALALGVSANTTDFTGRPVLQIAARTGNVMLVKRLVEAGSEVDAVDEIGFSAMMEAARDGHIDAVRYFLEQGADANRRSNENALYLTPMHMAGLSDKAEIVKLLSDAGAAVDPLGREDGTPLMWALGEGKMSAVMQLLESGANPHQKNSYGFSAADYARQMDNADLMEKMGISSAP